jgi:hypothetical protein
MYQKDVGERIPKLEPPLGEMLMCPSPDKGAVPLHYISIKRRVRRGVRWG